MEHKTLQFFQRPLQPGCLFSFLFFLMAFFLSQEAVAQESRKTVWQQIKEAEDGDVIDLKGETYEWNYIEFSGKKTVTLKNGTIIRPDGYSVNKVELLFGVGGGFKLILDEVKLKGGEFSKGAPVVYVKSGGILEMNGGGCTQLRADSWRRHFYYEWYCDQWRECGWRRGDQCCRGRNIGHERRTSQLGHQQWND